MFAHIINFILFRIVCPAINDAHNASSKWHLHQAAFDNSTEQKYNTNATLQCDVGYWLQSLSTEGKPHTNQTVTCGSNGKWTPPAVDCSDISMNLCENCLTSFTVVS